MADGREDDAQAFARGASDAADLASLLARSARSEWESHGEAWHIADDAGRASAPRLRKVADAAEAEAQSVRESAQAARRYAIAAAFAATPFAPMADAEARREARELADAEARRCAEIEGGAS
jgi:hypothetical protein